jgi:hypothetical protein
VRAGCTMAISAGAKANENDNLHHRVRNENATIGPPSIPQSGFRRRRLTFLQVDIRG